MSLALRHRLRMLPGLPAAPLLPGRSVLPGLPVPVLTPLPRLLVPTEQGSEGRENALAGGRVPLFMDLSRKL